MRLLLQRVTRAQVRVGGRIVSETGPGLVVLVGVGHSDTETVADAMADKVLGLRIFRDVDK